MNRSFSRLATLSSVVLSFVAAEPSEASVLKAVYTGFADYTDPTGAIGPVGDFYNIPFQLVFIYDTSNIPGGPIKKPLGYGDYSLTEIGTVYFQTIKLTIGGFVDDYKQVPRLITDGGFEQYVVSAVSPNGLDVLIGAQNGEGSNIVELSATVLDHAIALNPDGGYTVDSSFASLGGRFEIQHARYDDPNFSFYYDVTGRLRGSSLTVSALPLPSGFILLFTSLIGFLLYRRKAIAPPT